jgi:hypothetical protein
MGATGGVPRNPCTLRKEAIGHEGKEKGLSVVPWPPSLPSSVTCVEGDFSEVACLSSPAKTAAQPPLPCAS